jgi:signal transduction histidine kinase/CheY-like chemotaxis protein
VIIVAVILVSVLLQIAAVVMALRTLRLTGWMAAWLLVTAALGLMALRRIYVLVELPRTALSRGVLPNEVMGLTIAILMLGGVVLLRGTFETLAAQRAQVAGAGAQAQSQVDRMAAVMEAAPLPLWIAEDPECRTIRGNSAAARLLRLPSGANHSVSSPEAPVHFRMTRDGKDLPPEDLPMQRAVRTGEPVLGAPLDLLFEDGSVRHLLGNATPLKDDEGRIYGGVSSFVDLTEIRRAEEQVRQAMKVESLGLMAGGIAHDFNNLFQAMVGNLELALTRLPRDGEARVYLERLQGSLDRAARLSREILHVSGGDLRRPEPLVLSTIVARVLEAAGVPVEAELDPALPSIMADPLLVGRVAEGIIANAAEASPPGAPVRVRTLARRLQAVDLTVGFWPEAPPLGPCVVLEVKDQGHGIAAATLPRIFDPFFSTRNVGRGLGLAASLGIIRGHGGGIQVESLLDVGSVFRVYFPSREISTPEPRALAEAGGQGRLVLLADDEPDLRETLGEMLRDWFGLEVVEAKDGEEALERFRHQPEAFDLVLLDATMPRLGGVEVFQVMRVIRPGLRGVLLSGYAMEDSRERALSQGFTDFLKKPFTSGELAGVLERAQR